MKFTKILALALVAMLCMSGCSLISIQKAPTATTAAQDTAAQGADADTVVAEFDGGAITKAVADGEYATVVAMYESYGYELTDEEMVAEIKEDLLRYLCEEKIVEAKATEMELHNLSDEELAQLKQDAADQYAETLSYYKLYFEGDTDEEIEQQTRDYLAENDYTPESAETYMIESAWQEKLYNEVTKDVVVTDDEVSAAYEAMVETDRETYESDLYSFEYAMSTGEQVSWIPDGYRRVKHILIPFTEEEAADMENLTLQLEDAQYELDYMAEEALDAEEGDYVEGDTPPADGETVFDESTDEAAQAVEPTAEPTAAPDVDVPDEPDADEHEHEHTEAELSAQIASLNEQIAALNAKILEGHKTVLDEIAAKRAAGEDFDALIEAYGDDPGMIEEPGATQGYYVSADSDMWDAEFTSGAMALKAIGDVSEPVVSASGIHIIQYIGDVTGGAVPLDEIREQVAQSALEEAKTALYDETVAGWVEAANIKTYIDRMA